MLPFDGVALEMQSSDSIEKPASKPDMLGVIFKGCGKKETFSIRAVEAARVSWRQHREETLLYGIWF